MSRLALILVLLIYPRYCRDPVYFDRPQPNGVENAASFPSDYQGAYLTVGFDSTSVDSHYVTISGSRMNCRSVYHVTVHAESLRVMPEMRISRDTLYWLEPDIVSFSTFHLRNDSAVVRSVADRALFSTSDSTFLRILDGVCYLNFWNRESNAYHVEMLLLERDSLIHASIDMKREVDHLRQAFRVKEDGPSIFVDAEKSQMRRFVAEGGFRWRDKLARLRK